jgi:hypothetical protein
MTIPIALLMVVAQAASGAQSKPAATPILQVGVFSIGPDGKQQAAAYETSLATESVQYIAGCVIGGGNRPVPDRATDAWRLSGKVERMTDDEAVVRVDWQRIRSAGVATTAPGGSIQLTLHSGDRVPLDSATPDPTAGCGARTVSFEARFEPRPGWVVGPGGALSVSPEVTIMRRGAAAGGGGRVGSGVGQGSGVSGTGRAVHVETSVASSNVADETVSQAGQVSKPSARDSNQVRGDYDVDLFLVRSDKTHPEQPDFNLQGLILRKVGTADFAFSPFTIDTSAGPLNVQIRGSLRVTADEGSPQLVFTTMRSVRYSSNGPNREASSSSSGSSTTRNPMPGPDDVLSFELPPIRIPNSPATLPEQYSVRVRIR